MSQYIISFNAGSSGRFIAGLIRNWILETSSDDTYSQFNSAHDNNDYAKCYDLSKFDDPSTFYINPDVYKKFKFNTQEPKIVTTHVFPNFNDILENFTKPKVVVIAYNDLNFTEIALNNLFKNGFEGLMYDKNLNLDLNISAKFVQSSYPVLFNQQYDPNIILTQEQIKKLGDLYCLFIKKRIIVESDFINISESNIPEQFKKYTKVIQYNDLITRKDYVLSTLSDIIEKNITSNVIEQYDTYLNNREQFIQNYIPWINE